MSSERIPAYEQIKETLLEEIKRGTYPLDRPFVTERAICERFGVSRATAIRALGELVHLGVLTRQRGRGSFIVGPAALSPTPPPSVNDTRLIGCLFHHLRGQHPMAIIQGIEHLCRAANYHLLLFDSQGSAHTEALNIARARNVGVHGMIVYPTDGFVNAAYFDALQHQGVPLVLIDRYYPALPITSVVVDDFLLGFTLTDLLIQQGHRYIALLCEESACTSVQDRMTGYRHAHIVNNLPIHAELATVRPYLDRPAAARRARVAHWLTTPYRPTAYLTVNSECLEVAVSDLAALGVRIPNDAVMASMDNSMLDVVRATGAVSRTLPSYEMGSTAMSLLLDQINRPDSYVARQIVLPTTLPVSIVATVA